MATVTITIPDAVLARVLSGFCYQNGYSDTIVDPNNINSTLPNPVSKATFAKQQLIAHIVNAVRSYEISQAAQAAQQAASAAVDSQIALL